MGSVKMGIAFATLITFSDSARDTSTDDTVQWH